MTTSRQSLGTFGENLVAKKIRCPQCLREERTFRLLPVNFKCADLICDFCGYLAQVKTSRVKNVDDVPNQILGAAWKPQVERMDNDIFFSLFLVLIDDNQKSAIYYLPKKDQVKSMFLPRKPLSDSAKRSGWQGYLINFESVKHLMIRLEGV
jgi:hypothetical protein